ncbi:MAG: ROK family protein [Holdemanella porci]
MEQGLVIDKEVFQGAHGFANEVANTCLWNNGPSHGSIYPGGIEAICSGTAIEQRAKKAGLVVAHAGEVNDLALQETRLQRNYG